MSDYETNPFASLYLHLPPPTAAVSPTSDAGNQRHRIHSLNADVLIRQLPSDGLSFQLWPAAISLLSLLDSNRHFLDDVIVVPATPTRRIRILELGSGTGLVGIGIAAILGADVTVTDLAHVIGNLGFNAAANAEVVSGSGGEVRVEELSWGNVDQMERIGREYDLIVGSDVVYHDHLYDPLIETLKYFLVKGERKEEAVFVMAHLKRWNKESRFFSKAKKWFDVEVIHEDIPDEGKRVGVTVYRFAGKNRPSLGSGSGVSSVEPKRDSGSVSG